MSNLVSNKLLWPKLLELASLFVLLVTSPSTSFWCVMAVTCLLHLAI